MQYPSPYSNAVFYCWLITPICSVLLSLTHVFYLAPCPPSVQFSLLLIILQLFYPQIAWDIFLTLTLAQYPIFARIYETASVTQRNYKRSREMIGD